MDRPPPRIEPASGQNKLESGPFSALATCANKAVVGDSCIILRLHGLAKQKASFVFCSTKGPQRMALEKCGFLYTHYLKKEANFREKTCRTLFGPHKQNCMRNLERFWQSSILSKNPTALFPFCLQLSSTSFKSCLTVYYFCLICWWLILIRVAIYRYVWLQKVWFFSQFGHNVIGYGFRTAILNWE